MADLIWIASALLLIVLGGAFLASVAAWIVTARFVERDPKPASKHATTAMAHLDPDNPALDNPALDDADRLWDRTWLRDMRPITPEERADEIRALEHLLTLPNGANR